MIYSDGHVVIHPFTERDMTEQYRSWFHDPEVTRWNSHGLFPLTTERMKAFRNAIEGDSTSMIVWAIRVEWEHVGNCSIQSINWINRSAELAFVIGEKKVWGMGIGTVVGQMMLKHAFHCLNMNRVWTGTAENNVGMRRVAFKLGMQEEGRFRDAVFLNGAYNDVVMYSILQKEYDLLLERSYDPHV